MSADDMTQIVYIGGIEVTITGTQRITKTYCSAGRFDSSGTAFPFSVDNSESVP